MQIRHVNSDTHRGITYSNELFTMESCSWLIYHFIDNSRNGALWVVEPTVHCSRAHHFLCIQIYYDLAQRLHIIWALGSSERAFVFLSPREIVNASWQTRLTCWKYEEEWGQRKYKSFITYINRVISDFTLTVHWLPALHSLDSKLNLGPCDTPEIPSVQCSVLCRV